MDLIIRRSNNTEWPIEAEYGSAVLTFSGSLTYSRVRKESLRITAQKSLQTILVVVGIIGLVGLAIHILLNLDELGFGLLFGHSIFLSVFWASVVGDLYFIANRIESKQIHVPISDATRQTVANTHLDLFEMFTQEARSSWNSVVPSGGSENQPSNENLFLTTFLKSESVRTAFFRLGVNPQELIDVISESNNAAAGASAETLSGIISELPFAAFEQAVALRNNAIDTLMLTLGLIKHLPADHVVHTFLFEKAISQEDLEAVAVWTFNVNLLVEEDQTFRQLSKYKTSGGTNTGLTAIPTKYLDQFSRDLTVDAKYHRLPITLGRELDVDAVSEIFSDKLVNVLIKGEQGTGRTTVIEMLAHRMVIENVPNPLQDKRLVKLEISAIVGGQIPAEQVLSEALAEAALSGNIILVVEDIDLLARATGASGLSLLDQLMNILQQSGVFMIATTTPGHYITDLRQQSNFDQVFTAYELSELSEKSILAASCIRASLLESQHKVLFLFSTIKEAFQLSNKYMKDSAQPQKTIGLLAEAAAKHKGADKIIYPEDIQRVVGEKTHVPEETITQSEGDKLMNLEDELAKHVIGQKDAVIAVAESLRRARSGLSSGSRPLASFLFVGPTGVGKTELARTLTKVYFGDEKYLLRLDMSEYQGERGIDKLLGNQEDAHTTFITHLQNYPFCLFLLDEFEKASPAVINLFLQILEDGRITTAAGQTLDATQTIIIATSNAGTKEIQASLQTGETFEQIKARLVNEILQKQFAPELLNRFDGVILFAPLTPTDVEQIVLLRLRILQEAMLEKGFSVTFSQALISQIAQKAYDPMLGARPIRRYLQDHVESVIAKLILGKQIQRGSKFTLDIVNGEIAAVPTV